MRRKTGFLSVAMMMALICAQAQSMRNPLNLEPANVRLGKSVSPKKLSDMTFYRPDGVQLDRTRFAYGENGRKISEQNQRWSAENNAWTDVSKDDYSYSENRLSVVSDILASSSRKNPSKTETYYDNEKRKSYSLCYSWNKSTETWTEKPVIKGEWHYDGNGRVAEYVKQYRNKDTGAWDIPLCRILYSYDEKGNQREEIMQSRKNGESWENVGKYTYSCSENAVETVCRSYVASGDNWLYDGKIICTYDKDGDPARCEYYNSNAGESVSAYCVYTYSDTVEKADSPKDEDITVYPNPAVSGFDLVVPEELVGKTAFLFDLSGKQAKSVHVGNPRMKVDVSDLSKGIYVMKIDSYSKKIVINK
jgi:hypothetical protein